MPDNAFAHITLYPIIAEKIDQHYNIAISLDHIQAPTHISNIMTIFKSYSSTHDSLTQ